MAEAHRALRLYTIHRVFIVAGVMLGAALTVHGIHSYSQTNASQGVLMSIAGCALGIGLVLYLRWFNRKTK